MTYTVNISSRGTITIPQPIREEMASSKILIIKQGDGYLFKAIKKLSNLGKSLKPKIKLSDKDIKNLSGKTFIKTVK